MLCQAVSCVSVTIRVHVACWCCVTTFILKQLFMLFYCVVYYCFSVHLWSVYFIRLSFIISFDWVLFSVLITCVVLSVRSCQISVPMGRENGLWDYLGQGRGLECTALRIPIFWCFLLLSVSQYVVSNLTLRTHNWKCFCHWRYEVKIVDELMLIIIYLFDDCSCSAVYI